MGIYSKEHIESSNNVNIVIQYRSTSRNDTYPMYLITFDIWEIMNIDEFYTFDRRKSVNWANVHKSVITSYPHKYINRQIIISTVMSDSS